MTMSVETSAEMLPVLLRCRQCLRIQHGWQDGCCTRCWSEQLDEVPVPEQAVLLSWATYHANYRLPGFAPPYSVGLVEFADSLRTPCLLLGDLSTAQFGAKLPVRVAAPERWGDVAPPADELTAVLIPGMRH
jgi:uncharacterized OB-fold protein